MMKKKMNIKVEKNSWGSNNGVFILGIKSNFEYFYIEIYKRKLGKSTNQSRLLSSRTFNYMSAWICVCVDFRLFRIQIVNMKESTFSE